MSPCRFPRPLAGLLLPIVLAACATERRASSVPSPVPVRAASPASAAAAAPAAVPAVDTMYPPLAPAGHPWPGTWDLLGHGFPEGARRATMRLARTAAGDLTLLMLAGPPGVLASLRADADTLHVEWLVVAPEGDALMDVRVVMRGDSLRGRWSMHDGRVGGAVEGWRAR